jgi:hypothetical protein
VSFTEWIFLLGGLAIVGPMIAHLLAKPQYRRLPFTMLRFLQSGQIESRSRQKLRDLLILLLRCMIIVLIAMLFARPLLHIRPKSSQDRSVYCLGLDNSMSMSYSDRNGSYLDMLKDSAVDYIRAANDNAIFNIFAMASEDWMQDLSKEQSLAEVKALKIELGNTNIEDFLSGLRRIRRAGSFSGEMSVLVLSDFTPNTFRQFVDIAEPAAVDRIDYKLIASSQPISNTAIADAHVAGVFEGKLTLNAAVINYGQAEQHRFLTATTESSQSDPVDVSLSGNQRKNYQLNLDVGATKQQACVLPVELNLSSSDGLSADDTFYIGVLIPGREGINILLVGDGENELFLLKTAMDTLSRTNVYDTLRIKQVLMDDLTASDLEWADVVFSSTITKQIDNLASEIDSFIKAGGRFVCFVTEALVPDAAQKLWQQDILAALPGRYIQERKYIQSKPYNSRVPDVDHIAQRSLSNYRIDKILIKGCFECRQHTDAQLIWQFQDATGFIYLKQQGSGMSFLVNTSVDDSLGSLTKSSASIAFCRYLLGENHQVDEYCFTCDERILLSISGFASADAGQKQFWIETCDGKNRRASVVGSFLRVPDTAGIGWVKTIGKPAIYAGVNLPQGETDMIKPGASELADVMNLAFKTDAEPKVSESEVFHNKKRKPLWKIFAWIIILLLIVEPAVANRLKR